MPIVSVCLIILLALLVELCLSCLINRWDRLPAICWRIAMTLIFLVLLESGTLVLILHEKGATL
jgi:hypothetical protein